MTDTNDTTMSQPLPIKTAFNNAAPARADGIARGNTFQANAPQRRKAAYTKTILSGSVLLVCGLLLSGCGGDKRTAGSTAPKRQAAAQSHNHAAAASSSASKTAAASTADGSSVTVPASGVIQIDADDRMRFNVTEFIVQPGQTIQLTLSHTGRMPLSAMGHNVAILKQYTDVRAFSMAAARSAATDYIPRSMQGQVIAHTKMLGGGESDTITFTAPAEPGEYDFLCTFPAHFTAGMKGKMVVRR